MQGENFACNRRKALKLGASSVATLVGGAAVGSAQTDPEQGVVEESLELRKENDWSVHEWRSHLSDNDVKFSYSDGSAGDSESGPSIQNFPQNKTNLHLTYVKPYYSADDLIDLEWEAYIENQSSDDGNYPLDIASIGYDSDHYTRNEDRGEYGIYFNDSYGSRITDQDARSLSGTVIQWNDYNAWEDFRQGNDFTTPFWISGGYGEYVKPNLEKYDDSERKIMVDYHHTWGLASLDTIGFDPLPSVSFDFSGDKWVREAQATEAEMKGGDGYTNEAPDCPCGN